MAIIPPKQPKIMAKKYLIYRVLIVLPDGTRSSHRVRVVTDDIEASRKECMQELGAVNPVQKVFFHYREIDSNV